MGRFVNWNIGKVKVTCITELENAGNVIQDSIPFATVDKIKKIGWLVPEFANLDGTLKAHTQSFLLEIGELRILIDTCVGNDKKRVDIKEWGNLKTDYLQKINEAGCKVSDITHIMCTHLHFDHVGFNTTLSGGKWIPTFPNAKYIFSKAEFEYWSKMPSSEIEDDRQGIRDSIMPIIEENKHLLVDDNFELCDEVKLIPTPGHTPHHCSVTIDSQGEKGLITGDFIHHPCQMENIDWYTLADTDKDKATQTRKTMLEKYSDSQTLVFGSHFSYPVAGYIVSDNNKYKFGNSYVNGIKENLNNG